MSRFLHRLGHGAAAHPWRTICAWLAIAVAVLGAAATIGGIPQDDYDVTDARAQVGIEQLRQHLPGAGNASARVVVHDRSGSVPASEELAALSERLRAMDHVVHVSPPLASPDGDTALLEVAYDVPVTDPDLMGNLEPLEDATAPTAAAGLQVELGGEVPDSAAAPLAGRGEIVGLVAALLLLVLTFGSVIAAGLPLLTAVAGLAVGTGGVTLLAAVTDVSTAASTVLVSLMGLRLAGLPVYSSFGYATAIAVVAVAAASLTLVPALCALAGHRLLLRRVRRGRAQDRMPLTARWARQVGRAPLPWAIGATLLLLTLAVPVLQMRTWPQDPSSQSTEMTTRRAFDLVAEEYGPGANGPLTIVVDRARLAGTDTAQVAQQLDARADIVGVTPVTTWQVGRDAGEGAKARGRLR